MSALISEALRTQPRERVNATAGHLPGPFMQGRVVCIEPVIMRPSAALRRQIEIVGSRDIFQTFRDDATVDRIANAIQKEQAAHLSPPSFSIEYWARRHGYRDTAMLAIRDARAGHTVRMFDADVSVYVRALDAEVLRLGGASDTEEASWLDLQFFGTTYSGIGGGLIQSGAVGSYYYNTHTATLVDANDQTTSVSAWTSYAAVTAARTTGAFTRVVSTVTNATATNWPACTGGSGTTTSFSLGRASSGAGGNVYYGNTTSTLGVSNGITQGAPIGNFQFSFD